MKQVEIYEKAPEGFFPHVEIAACYLEVEGKLLLLQRALEKTEPGLWGVPAGKIEKGETPEEGALRELFEETGIALKHPSQIRSMGLLYIRKPGVDYVYHLFKVLVDSLPEVHLSAEHLDYTWATPQEIKTLPLVGGALEALKYYGWNL